LIGPVDRADRAGAAPAEAPAGTYVVRTDDGGKTWTRPPAHPLSRSQWASISRLTFADSKHGWACGDVGGVPIILETSDGGEDFRALAGLPKDIGACYGVYFRPSAGLWIYGSGFVLHSGDDGKTWEEPPDITQLGIDLVSSAFFFDDGRGWLFGHGPGWSVLSTIDFGRHWQPAPGTDARAILNSAWFSDAARGCTVGNSSTLLCTSDGGLTWNARTVLPGQRPSGIGDFTRVVMLPSSRGWVLRVCGFLYETTDGGRSWRAFDPLEPGKSQ
jgi:photosystem II stability/assembly factor-like uncharacterized protein